MTVQEIMDRAGTNQTGRAVAYIKDGLEEIQIATGENRAQGSLAHLTANTISFTLSGSQFATTLMDAFTTLTGWTEWDGDSVGTLSIYDGAAILAKSNTNAGNLGFYNEASITPIIGAVYEASIDFEVLNLGDFDTCYLSVGATGGSTYSTGELDTNFTNSVTSINENLSAAETGTMKMRFRITDSSVTNMYWTVHLNAIGIESIGSVKFTNPVLKNITYIRDTGGRFGGFKDDMKILVSNSTSNDTEESNNTSTGFYTAHVDRANPGAVTVAASSATANTDSIYSVHSNVITCENALFTSESAGETITVRGQTLNYMDLIENKRFYNFPSDMMKLYDVKIKNHKNSLDKYRSIPRSLNPPLETDADGH